VERGGQLVAEWGAQQRRGNTYNVDIVDGSSTVTLNLAATIDDLTMGTGNTLVIPTGQQLTVLGPPFPMRAPSRLTAVAATTRI